MVAVRVTEGQAGRQAQELLGSGILICLVTIEGIRSQVQQRVLCVQSVSSWGDSIRDGNYCELLEWRLTAKREESSKDL